MIARPYAILPTMNRHSLLCSLAMVAALTVSATALFAAPGVQPVKQPVKQPGKQPVKQPVKQPGKQPVKQPGKQTVKSTPQMTAPVMKMTEPPEIIISTRPALLVTIDGPPEYALVKGAEPFLWRVVNTKVLLLKNAGGRHYLHLYDGFLEAGSLNEPWLVAAKVPRGAKLAELAARSSQKKNLLEGKPDPRTKKRPSLRKVVTPWVYLSMIPAELIVTDGEPDFISIKGTSLFYARNTTGDLFWRQGDGTLYLLASGYWFRAESYLGPWVIAPDEELPEDFRAIPDSSVKRRVKAWVPPPPPKTPSRKTPETGNDWLKSVLAERVPRQIPKVTAGGFSPETAPKECCR